MGYDGDEQAWGSGAASGTSRVSRPPQVSHPDGWPPANDPFSKSGGLGSFAKAKSGGWARVDAMYPVQVDPGVFSWMDAEPAVIAAQRLDRFVTNFGDGPLGSLGVLGSELAVAERGLVRIVRTGYTCSS